VFSGCAEEGFDERFGVEGDEIVRAFAQPGGKGLYIFIKALFNVPMGSPGVILFSPSCAARRVIRGAGSVRTY